MFFDRPMDYPVASATTYVGDFEGCIAFLGTMEAGILCSIMGGSPCEIVVIRRYLCKIQSFDMSLLQSSWVLGQIVHFIGTLHIVMRCLPDEINLGC